PDTIGALTVKPHLEGKLCNSFASGSEVKEFDVPNSLGMKKYLIEWTMIDWCAHHTSTNREFSYTQEVIATINPDCDVTTDTGDDTTDVSLVQGTIATERGEAVQKVEMKAVLGSGSPLTTVTGGEGAYNFSINNGSQVSLVPSKNTGFANGVSTQDLIAIQRHVLQKKALDSKYQRIAADVDGNGSINGFDVLELRKLVMQPHTKFANNTSWRFFDKQTDKEVYDVANVNGDMNVDFVGVKIGDVNLSSSRQHVGSRSTTGTLNLNMADKAMKGGEVYRIDVTSDNFVNINGMQYTLSYVTNLVEIESIEAGALNITKDNYVRYAPGVITSSWSEADGQHLSSDEVLFTLVVKAKSEVRLRDALSLNNRVTTTEAYVDVEAGDFAKGYDPRRKAVSLRFDGFRLGDGMNFALYQNTPNPYAGETVIGFHLPETSEAVMTVYDVTGRLIKRINGEYEAGYNEVRLTSTDLGVTGVLYYQLDTKKYTATKKMIVIE
ncbi:T9SS type A sorting domain-containing protein, partial [Membranicola marinus]